MNEYGHLKNYMDYVEKRRGRKLILFGASSLVPVLVSTYFVFDKIEFICDSNPKKWGKTIMGIPICSPDKLSKTPDEFVVIISVVSPFYMEEIKECLSDMKIRHVYDFQILDFITKIETYDSPWCNDFQKIDIYQIICDNEDKIQKVRSILSDERSVYVYDAIIQKMKYSIGYYADICDDPFDEYFGDGIFQYEENEVFIDGGSYDGGDTIKFSKTAGKSFKKAYCFEPDCNNYLHTCKNLSKAFKEIPSLPDTNNKFECEKFTVFKAGLFNTDRNLGFLHLGYYGSRFDEGSDNGGEDAVSGIMLDHVIDNTEKVTFIKLDVEGAELAALQGGREIIQRDKPKLAISIYHMVEDLWEIPLYIKQLVPEYKFYVRHHQENSFSKVLYATL